MFLLEASPLEASRAISLVRVVLPSPNTYLEPMRSYIVKENHIGSAVSEILWYRQTDILILLYKDYLLNKKISISNHTLYFIQTFIYLFLDNLIFILQARIFVCLMRISTLLSILRGE